MMPALPPLSAEEVEALTRELRLCAAVHATDFGESMSVRLMRSAADELDRKAERASDLEAVVRRLWEFVGWGTEVIESHSGEEREELAAIDADLSRLGIRREG